jgi:hypothetical protein
MAALLVNPRAPRQPRCQWSLTARKPSRMRLGQDDELTIWRAAMSCRRLSPECASSDSASSGFETDETSPLKRGRP